MIRAKQTYSHRLIRMSNYYLEIKIFLELVEICIQENFKRHKHINSIDSAAEKVKIRPLSS